MLLATTVHLRTHVELGSNCCVGVATAHLVPENVTALGGCSRLTRSHDRLLLAVHGQVWVVDDELAGHVALVDCSGST